MNIREVAESHGVELKQQGKLYVGFCPFHDDKNTPNFFVYEETQSWFCYACNHGGDVIKFISLIEGKDYNEVKKLYIHEYTQDNLRKAETEENDIINLKNETYIRTSNICREFLHKNKDALSHVFPILKKLDERLSSVDILEYTERKKIVDKFKNYIYNLKEVKQ